MSAEAGLTSCFLPNNCPSPLTPSALKSLQEGVIDRCSIVKGVLLKRLATIQELHQDKQQRRLALKLRKRERRTQELRKSRLCRLQGRCQVTPLQQQRHPALFIHSNAHLPIQSK